MDLAAVPKMAWCSSHPRNDCSGITQQCSLVLNHIDILVSKVLRPQQVRRRACSKIKEVAHVSRLSN
jgi:hypothetical protein